MTVTGNETKAFSAGEKEPDLAAGAARIYSMRFCPFAERALLYAAKHGIDVEVVNINLSAKPDWYFKKHPKGTVPAYEQDGKVVIESNHIPLFLDDLHPQNSIQPKDPFERAQQRILADQLSVINTAFFGIFRLIKSEAPTEEAAAEVVAAVENALDEAEKLFPAGKTYYGGVSPSYADYMVFPFVERYWAALVGVLPEFLKSRGIPTAALSPFPKEKDAAFPGASRWPTLTKWFGTIKASKEVAAVSQPFENLVHYQEMHIAGKVDFDYGL